MASKKYSFFIGVLSLLASGAYAQVGTNYDVLDSSYYSTKSLPQFNEFRNNAYPFPPKPKNQWEVGIKGGLFTIASDVPSVFPTGGFGVHVRKSLGYVVSLRGEFDYGVGKGLGWQRRTGGFSTPFAAYRTAGGVSYDNYKAKVKNLDLDAVFTINNIRFHKAKTNFVVYGFGGLGATFWRTAVDAKNSSGGNYAFNTVPAGTYDNRKD